MGSPTTEMTLPGEQPSQPCTDLASVVRHSDQADMDFPSDPTSEMRLSDLLRLRMEKSAFEKTPYNFLPQGALDSLITKKTIFRAMGITCATKSDSILAFYILTKAKRLFATAVYIGLPPRVLHKAMRLFLLHNFQDSKLPLEEMNGKQFLSNKKSGVQHPLIRMEGRRFGKETIWTFPRVHAFLEEQFKFLAPVMSTRQPNHDFGNRILPFVKKHAAQAEGSFGLIYKYEIHPDHIQQAAGQYCTLSNILAVKEIKANDASDRQQVAKRWESEVKALAMMNELKQDHIVRFITSFRRGSLEAPEHYLITEWADGGNLHDLWKTIPNPPLTVLFVKAVVRQLRGLADALKAAHYPEGDEVYWGESYRHGDLKPANILWFRDGDPGTLKIGDWGEAKSHQTVTAMRQSNTTAQFGTRRYEPPESEIGVDPMDSGPADMRRSRLYDIWSIGCITLEIVIWLMYGITGLGEFNKSLNDSPFYKVTKTGKMRSAQVHDVVLSWMDYILQDPACYPGTTALGDLLSLVRRGLLVVDLPDRYSVRRNSSVQAEDETGIMKINVTSAEHESGIPMINVIPAEGIEANDVETQPEPSKGILRRLRADQLRDKLKLIEQKDDMDNYWSTQPELPMPDVTSDPHFTAESRHFSEGRTQPYRDYTFPKRLQAGECIDVDQNSATTMDLAFRGLIPPRQSKNVTGNDEDDEIHFTSRGRPKGSKNRRTAQPTTEESKTSNSESSGLRRPKAKRPRVEGDDRNEDDEQDDQEGSLPHKGSRESKANLNLACPFAKKAPLEHPHCRQRAFRDIAKIKEHLRDHHSRHCVRCGEGFFNKDALLQHIRQTPSCETRDTPEECFTYMTDEQEAILKNTHGILWSTMYQVLFPDCVVPVDPDYKDSEDLVFSLITIALGSPNPPLPVFQAYRLNCSAESTCSARAALQYGLPTTTSSQSQSDAFPTSDSGYSGPPEDSVGKYPSGTEQSGRDISVTDPSALNVEGSGPNTGSRILPDPTCSSRGSNTGAASNAIHQQHVQQETAGQAISFANIDLLLASGNLDTATDLSFLAGNKSDTAPPLKMEQPSTTEPHTIGASLSPPSSAMVHDADWMMPQSPYNLDFLNDVPDLPNSQ